jgi:hypothetical protein
MTTMTLQSLNTQCLPPLNDVLWVYFQSLESMDRSGDAAVGKNLVNNLKRENASDAVIYKELMALFPDV